MTHELETKPTSADLAPLGELLGPPPVLSTENAKAYEEVLARLTQCLAPRDFLEQMLIKQVADSTWEIMRCMRHKKLAVERRAHQNREIQAKRAKAAAANRDAQARSAVASTPSPASEAEQMLKLQQNVNGVVKDVDDILAGPVDELDHARAFEESIVYYEKLDDLLNAAIAGRTIALEQLGRYRHGWGKILRKASDEIIDADFKETAPDPQQITAPLVPAAE